MSAIGEVSVVEDMRMLAMSRLVLDNVPHIKAYWVMYGKQTAEMALGFGADDIDGTDRRLDKDLLDGRGR